MSTVASQITGVPIGLLNRLLGADQRKHQGPASLAFVGVSNTENVSIWWRPHDTSEFTL